MSQRLFVPTQASIRIHAHINTYTAVHIHRYVYVNTQTSVRVHLDEYIDTHTSKYAYKQTRIHMLAYIHTHPSTLTNECEHALTCMHACACSR